MKIMTAAKASGFAALFILVALAGAHASADGADESGWYVGGNLGLSQADVDKERITRALANGGLTTTSFDEDGSAIGYKLFGGYQFNPYFALEGGYFDLGEFGFTAATSPPGTLSGDTTVRGLNIDPVGIWPLTDKLSAFGRVGLSYVETESRYRASGAITPPPGGDNRAANYKVGVGLQYDFARAWGARAEIERYRIEDAVGNDGDADLFSLGLVYRFFGNEAPAAKQSAAPVPASKPAPVLVIVPVAAKTVKYCSILDIQFEINQEGIQREEKEKLGVLATFLKKYPDTTALIEGHADNVGTPADNQRLSEQRAESVVAYLRDTAGIAGSRLSYVGYGDTRPLASNESQEGMRRNRRIGAVIACAQDIEGLKVIPARITMAMDMEFDASRATVRPEYREELRRVAQFMKANPTLSATIEGHTGDLERNAALSMEMSQRRAQAVVDALVEFGVPRSRLAAQGFGQTRRFAYNTTLEGQQENRRVNIIFNYGA